jgi:hypothetical protein
MSERENLEGNVLPVARIKVVVHHGNLQDA